MSILETNKTPRQESFDVVLIQNLALISGKNKRSQFGDSGMLRDRYEKHAPDRSETSRVSAGQNKFRVFQLVFYVSI